MEKVGQRDDTAPSLTWLVLSACNERLMASPRGSVCGFFFVFLKTFRITNQNIEHRRANPRESFTALSFLNTQLCRAVTPTPTPEMIKKALKMGDPST